MQLSNDDLLSGFGELVGCGVNGNDDPIPGGTRVDAGWAVEPHRQLPCGRVGTHGTVGLAGATTEYAAQNSGQMSCGQSVAGGDISINLVPAADTLIRPPSPAVTLTAAAPPGAMSLSASWFFSIRLTVF